MTMPVPFSGSTRLSVMIVTSCPKSGTFTSEPPPNLNDYGPKGSKRDTMCGCGRALSQSYHGCPYKQAVGAAGREIGESSLCKCCEVCTHNCYMNS